MNGFIRILIYGIQGFRRNIWLSIIAIITMSLTVTTVTIFGLGNIVANKFYQEQNNRINYVILVKDEASDSDYNQFKDQITSRTEVAQLITVSKDEALKKFKEFYGDNESLKGAINGDNNPLLREMDVKFKDPNSIDSFDKFVSQERFKSIIYSTTYVHNKDLISKYLRLANLLKVFSISFTGFFLVIALIVILNTIRLAIFSRREEIEIMRLVGATRGYVRGPFLVEGILFGLIGSLVSGVLTWVLMHQLQIILATSFNDKTTNFITELFGSSLGGIASTSGFNVIFSIILIAQILVGLALGVLCSFIGIRRYLKE